MKYLLFLFVAGVFTVSPVFSQTGKKTQVRAKMKMSAARIVPSRKAGGSFSASAAKSVNVKLMPSSDILKETAVGVWGVADS